MAKYRNQGRTTKRNSSKRIIKKNPIYSNFKKKAALLYEAEQKGNLMEFNLDEQPLFNTTKKEKKQIEKEQNLIKEQEVE